MSHSWCPSSHHLLCHFSLPSEGRLLESPRNEVPLSLPVPAATSQEPPLPFLPAVEHVPHPPAPAGSAAVQGRCRPCASPDQAWLPHGSEAPALLEVNLWSQWMDRNNGYMKDIHTLYICNVCNIVMCVLVCLFLCVLLQAWLYACAVMWEI